MEHFSLDSIGGPVIETKFTKWSVSQKRLRTADLEECAVDSHVLV